MDKEKETKYRSLKLCCARLGVSTPPEVLTYLATVDSRPTRPELEKLKLEFKEFVNPMTYIEHLAKLGLRIEFSIHLDLYFEPFAKVHDHKWLVRDALRMLIDHGCDLYNNGVLHDAVYNYSLIFKAAQERFYQAEKYGLALESEYPDFNYRDYIEECLTSQN